ncbi:hypothetical protein [Intestinibacillus massiliensis]
MSRPKYKPAYRDACELLAIVYGDCPHDVRGWPCSTVCPALQDMGRCMVDFLHGCFVDWIHDPSVGLYGMTDGEAALANAIMSALTSAEVEVPLGGGKDG